MKKLIIYFILGLLFSSTVYSQDSNEIKQMDSILYSQNISLDENIPQATIDYDSIWCFHPFSINLYAGVWSPLGQLNEYFNPSLKLGVSFGLMIAENIKIEYGLAPIFQNNSTGLDFTVNDSIMSTKNASGFSLGGWITYSVYKDRNFYIDLLSGITWETLSTDIENSNNDPKDEYDDNLSVSTYGVSFGTDIWINKFGSHNVGIRVLYCYAAYNKDEILISEIGGNSVSISLIYRFSRRNQIYRKYY